MKWIVTLYSILQSLLWSVLSQKMFVCKASFQSVSRPRPASKENQLLDVFFCKIVLRNTPFPLSPLPFSCPRFVLSQETKYRSEKERSQFETLFIKNFWNVLLYSLCLNRLLKNQQREKERQIVQAALS